MYCKILTAKTGHALHVLKTLLYAPPLGQAPFAQTQMPCTYHVTPRTFLWGALHGVLRSCDDIYREVIKRCVSVDVFSNTYIYMGVSILFSDPETDPMRKGLIAYSI